MSDNYLSYLLSLDAQGIKLGLERTRAILSSCGNPQKQVKSIQVVGTNGKGSTCAMISNILICAGYKVGLYTSPHLNKINERIRVNGTAITNDDFKIFINQFKQDINKFSCSFFEVMTAIALWFFKKNNVDIAILETGLGGRLDSVSCCDAELIIFTQISLDHQHLLGETIEEIAEEKAGAIKHKIRCISTKQQASVEKVLNRKADLFSTKVEYISMSKQKHSSLIGIHQQINESLAISTVTSLLNFSITSNDIEIGLADVKWPGRLQKIKQKPFIIFDVAHNEASFYAMIKFVSSLNIIGKKIIILALQKHKNIDSVITDICSTFDNIIFTQTNIRNFVDAQYLFTKFPTNNKQIINNPSEAIRMYKNYSPDDCIVICGTHYLGGYICNEFKISFDNI